MTTREDAIALVERLGDLLADLRETVQQIIETRAWESAGYPSFAAMWKDRRGDFRVTIPGEQQALAFAILSTGGDEADVRRSVTGIGPARARELAREFYEPEQVIERRATKARPPTPTRRYPAYEMDSADFERAERLRVGWGISRQEFSKRALLSYLDRQGE